MGIKRAWGSLKRAWEVENGWVGGVMGSWWVGTHRCILNVHGGVETVYGGVMSG